MKKRIFAGLTTAAVAGALILGAAAPAAAATNAHPVSTTEKIDIHPDDGPIAGPFPDYYSCAAYGQAGISYGYWYGFDCIGSGNSWWLYVY